MIFIDGPKAGQIAVMPESSGPPVYCIPAKEGSIGTNRKGPTKIPQNIVYHDIYKGTLYATNPMMGTTEVLDALLGMLGVNNGS